MAEYTNRDTYNCDYFSIFVSIFQASEGSKKWFLHIAYIAFANFDKWIYLYNFNKFGAIFSVKLDVIYIVLTFFSDPKCCVIFAIENISSPSQKASRPPKFDLKSCTKITKSKPIFINFNCKFFVNCTFLGDFFIFSKHLSLFSFSFQPY